MLFVWFFGRPKKGDPKWRSYHWDFIKKHKVPIMFSPAPVLIFWLVARWIWRKLEKGMFLMALALGFLTVLTRQHP